jgi:hypothetical protein
MGTSFWIRRFLVVLAGAFAVIFAAQLLKGHAPAAAATMAAGWALLAASVFTASRIHQSRRGQHCALCRDTPEMQRDDGTDAA